MTMNMFRWSILSLAGFVLCSITGCTRWIDVKPASATPKEATTHSLPNDERVPLVTNSFHLSRNGSSQYPSVDLERRILSSVQETSLFSTLIPLGEKSDSLGDKAVSAHYRRGNHRASLLALGVQRHRHRRIHVSPLALH